MSTISASTTTTTAYVVTADTTGALVLQTGATPTTAMTIDTSQNVGIGTSSPSYKLNVVGGSLGISNLSAVPTYYNNAAQTGDSGSSSSTRTLMQLQTSGSQATAGTFTVQGIIHPSVYRINIDSSTGSGSAAPLSFSTSNGATETMRIDSSGNVMVNTTSAADKFTVGGNMCMNVANGYLFSNGGGSSGSVNAGINFDGSGSTLRFYTSGAGNERMRIDSSGNLLVNTTSNYASSKVCTNGAFASNTNGVDGSYQPIFNGVYSSNTAQYSTILHSMSSIAGNAGFRFDVGGGGGGGTTQSTSFYINRTSCTVVGSLSKGSGSFKIDHPLTEKKDTHHLVHSFIEGPQADLIYRGKVNLVAGTATVNIDTASTMTEGTFVALCRDVQCFTTNESDWTPVRGSVTGNILTIEAQDNTSTASISWMVIGERQDKHMYETDWTDKDGKVIVEPTKTIEKTAGA